MWYKWLIVALVLLLYSCVDLDPASLTLTLNPGVDTVEVNSVFEDAGAKATLSGRSHTVIILENTVDLSQVGTYIIVYQTTYRDVTREVKRFVDVIDETPPVLTLNPGIDTILLDSDWVDAGVTVTDNSGLDVTVNVTGEVITSMIGEYRITYTAEDAYGNRSEIIRYVNVIDPTLH